MKRVIENGVIVALVVLAAVLTFFGLLQDSGITGFVAGEVNMPPEFTASSTKFVLDENKPFVLELNSVFRDPEGQPLTFIATQTENVLVGLQEDRLTITPEPGFSGTRVVTVIASDGGQIASKRLVLDIGVMQSPVQEVVLQQETPATPAVRQGVEEQGIGGEPEIFEKVEAEVEEALQDSPTVSVIILLKDPSPAPFVAKASDELKEGVLEEQKADVAAAQELVLEAVAADADVQITGAVTADEIIAPVEVTRQYETVNAIAVEVTLEGLELLRNDPNVAQVVLDREFTASLADSVPLIDANDVWNSSLSELGVTITGINETVCIIDTGIDLNHSVFAGRIVGGYDFVNNDDSPQDDASNSHGTHVAGIIAGNSASVMGVAPDARIVPVKVCNSGGGCSASNILAGIDYCNNNAVAFNITVLSGSLGDNAQHTSADCPGLFESAFNTSVALGIVPVFASGNNGFTGGVSYPACSPYVISAGSSSKSDALDTFTNRGGDRLDVLAPGSSITSAAIGGGTRVLSGTSMSAPHVSGTIALIQQNQKVRGRLPLSLLEMRQLLKETGKQVDSWNRIDALTAIIKLNQNYSVNLTDNSVTNATPPKARVRFNSNVDFKRLAECATVRHNFVEIDSASCPEFNTSAHIVFEGLAGINAVPLRNSEPCPESICTNVSFSSGNLSFDVSEFTSYSSQSEFETQNISGCPVTINETTVMNQSVSSATGCVTFGANNIALDCNGSTINFNSGGGDSAFGIVAFGRANVTVRNCIIRAVNETGDNIIGINFTRVNGSLIVNNTVIANGTSGVQGILIQEESSGNTIENNTILAPAGGQVIIIRTNVSALNITNNSIVGTAITGITISATANNRVSNVFILRNVINGSGGSGISVTNGHRLTVAGNIVNVTDSCCVSHGITLTTSHNHTIENNSFGSSGGNGIEFSTVNNSVLQNNIGVGDTLDSGIDLTSSQNNTLINNTATSNLSQGLVLFSSSNNRLFNNTGISMSSQPGILFTGANLRIRADGNTGRSVNGTGVSIIATNSNFTNTTGASDKGIALTVSTVSQNTTFGNTTLITNGTWLDVRGGSGSGITRVNFTNTLFQDLNGSIRIIGLANVSSVNATRARLNVTGGRAFLNATNLSFFNSSAEITLNGITAAEPVPVVDFDDDGTFVTCPPSQCTSLSYASGVFVFNTTRFTAYAAGSPVVLTKTDNIDPATANMELNYTIFVNVTSGNASNVTLTDIYPSQVIFNRSQPDAVSGTNNTFVLGNLTNGTLVAVNITVFIRNITQFVLINNTANISYQNSTGGLLALNVTENTTLITGCPVTINTSTTLTGGLVGTGSCVIFGASNIFLDCAGFMIRYGISGGNDTIGVNVTNVNNATVRNCTILRGSASGSRNYGVLLRNSSQSRIENNTIITNGTGGENNAVRVIPATTMRVNYVTNNGDLNNPFCSNGTGGVNDCRVCFSGSGVTCTTIGLRACQDGRNVKTQTVLDFNLTSMPSRASTTIIGGEAMTCTMNGVSVLIISVKNSCGMRRTVDIPNSTFVIGQNNFTCSVKGRGFESDNGFKMSSFFIELPATRPAVTIRNNTINTDGGNESHGIFLNGDNSNITLNNVTTGGVGAGHGILIETGSIGNRIANNAFHARPLSSDGVQVFYATGNTFDNNTFFNATRSAYFLDHSLANVFNNSIIPAVPAPLLVEEENGSINYTQGINITNATNLSQVIFIGFNFTRVNTTDPAGSQLNGSAILSFFALPSDGIIPVMDPQDDATFEDCFGERCSGANYTQESGILQFNVTGFTTYAAKEISVCTTLDLDEENQTNATFVLRNNVNANGSCFRIAGDNVTLNCSGFIITGNGSGIGINATNVTNIAIENCVVRNFENNILLTNVTAGLVRNNSATNSSGAGIVLLNSFYNRVINNSVQASTNYGIWLLGTSGTNLTANNATSGNSSAIRLQGANTGSGVGSLSVSGFGVSGIDTASAADSYCQNNSLFNNTGISSDGEGIMLHSCNLTQVIDSNGTSDSGAGIRLLGSNQILLLNNNATSISGNGILLDANEAGGGELALGTEDFTTSPASQSSATGSNNNTLINNTAKSDTATAIVIRSSSENTVINNTAFSKRDNGITLAGGVDSLFRNNNATSINKTGFYIGFSTAAGGGLDSLASKSFTIKARTPAGWSVVGVEHFSGLSLPMHRYPTKTFVLQEPAGVLHVSHNGTDTAHIDSALLDGQAPFIVMDLSTGRFLNPAKLALADYDVVDAVERTLELVWAETGSVLSLTAVEEDLVGVPTVWPKDGYAGYVLGAPQAFSYEVVPFSTHPVANVTAVLGVDGQDLLVKIDRTTDNTLDYGGDWAEFRVLQPEGIAFFRINSTLNYWGTSAYEYTDAVPWQHKTYSFRIPFASINSSLGDVIGFQIGYYGTESGGSVVAVVCNNNTFFDNVASSTNGVGMNVSQCTNSTFVNNTVRTANTVGLAVFNLSRNNRFSNTTVQAGNGTGILLSEFVTNNSFLNTTIASNLVALQFLSSAQNTTFLNTTLLSNGTWIISDSASTANNLTNTLFDGSNGSIRYLLNTTIPANTNVSISKLNITFNRAFLNSSNLSFLNLSAEITLRNLLFNDPRPVVDFNDTLIFQNCSSQNCTELSYAGGALLFNVTQFTTYSAVEGGVNISLAKTDSADPVSPGANLNYTISINVSQERNASNITLTDVYPGQVVFVNSSPQPLAGTNNTFVIGNLTPGQSFIVNITVQVLGSTPNGTLVNNTANISFQNSSGTFFFLNVTESTLVITSTPVLGGSVGAGVGGVGRPKPPEAERPFEIQPSGCLENWTCQDWGSCINGLQSRTCIDLNWCNTTVFKPLTEQSCSMPQMPAPERPVFVEPAVEEPKEKVDVKALLCVVIPIAVRALLLALALLALAYILLSPQERMKKRWLVTFNATAVIILALLALQVIACDSPDSFAFIIFVLIVLFVLLARFAAYLHETRMQIVQKKPIPVRPKPAVEAFQPVLYEELKDVESTITKNAQLIRKFKKALKKR